MKKDELLNKAFDIHMESHYISSVFSDVIYTYNGVTISDIGLHVLGLINSLETTNITQIASLTKRSTSAVFKIVRNLLKRELIIQTRSSEDKRIYNLSVTEKGKAVLEKDQKYDILFKANIFENLSSFTKDEIETYIRVLSSVNHAMIKNMEYLGEISE